MSGAITDQVNAAGPSLGRGRRVVAGTLVAAAGGGLLVGVAVARGPSALPITVLVWLTLLLIDAVLKARATTTGIVAIARRVVPGFVPMVLLGLGGLGVALGVQALVPDDPDLSMRCMVGAVACLGGAALVTDGARALVAGLWEVAGLVAFFCLSVVAMILLFNGLYGDVLLPAAVIGVVSGAWFVLGRCLDRPAVACSTGEPIGRDRRKLGVERGAIDRPAWPDRPQSARGLSQAARRRRHGGGDTAAAHAPSMR